MVMPLLRYAVAALLPLAAAAERAPTSPCASKRAPDAVLPELIRGEALPVLEALNHQELGAEAARVRAWIDARAGGQAARLNLVGRCLRHPADGATLRLSPALAEALRRLGQWYDLIPATLAHPVTPEELETGALTPDTIERVADIFATSIDRAVPLDGRWHVPETGGEATLDGALQLFEMQSPTWPTVRALARCLDDPVRLADLWDERKADLTLLDVHGLLRGSVQRFRMEWPGSGRSLREAARTIARNASEAYALEPAGQFALILQHEWRGRYVGRWHTHAPHDQGRGWQGAAEPSFQDMQNARRDGQFLTLAFQPDGFDLYDAAGLAGAAQVDLSRLRVVRHRSAAWRGRFERLHALLRAGPGPCAP